MVHTTHPRIEHQHRFSIRRSTIIALVVFTHGMLGLYLLAPAAPLSTRSQAGAGARSGRQNLVLVFLGMQGHATPHADHAADRRESRHAVAHPKASRLTHEPHEVQVERHPPLNLSLPDPTRLSGTHPPAPTPDYISGGRGFQEGLKHAIRREHRQWLPRHEVPGMPHFAMTDPPEGVGGWLHALTRRAFGGPDPACIEADRSLIMTDAERARRFIDRGQVQQTADHLHCTLKKPGWMAPSGPATHLTASPPGHGIEQSGHGFVQ